MQPSAADIGLLAVEALTAAALLVLWLSDRQRIHMLLWAIAHAMLPLMSLALGLLRQQPSVGVVLLISAVTTIQATCLTAGVFHYSRRPINIPWLIGITALLTALLFAATLFTPAVFSRSVGSLLTIAAITTSALLLWPLGIAERVAATCLALRCVLATSVAIAHVTEHSLLSLQYVPGFTVLLATATVLALLVAVYRRSLAHLHEQFSALELAQQLTAQLRTVTSEEEMAQRLLAVLRERLDWEIGIYLAPTPQPLVLRRIATIGNPGAPTLTGEFLIPEGGLIGTALRTGCVTHTAELPSDPRVNQIYRGSERILNGLSLVVIPAAHDGKVIGLIVLHDRRRRELSSAELGALQNLGQVIGLSVANLHNLNELAHRAEHDALTGLGNRAALHEQLQQGATLHPDRRGAVMLFDLDHFKQINDALGHAIGDQLLQALAARLQAYLADQPGRIYRLGGDEFVIVHRLEAGSAEEALAIARRIAAVIAEPLQIGELSLRTSASIGIALGPEHGHDSHELLRCADVAMYHAKQHGAGVTLYERDIDAHKLEHLTLLSAVSEGLERDQFELHYQPFINLATGAIDGCEGLIRWRHPTLGLVGAAEFMPLVEATDLIRAITCRVIDIAVADAARWQQLGIDARIAINLSARNLLDAELPDYLLHAVARHRVEPHRLQLEITETILIKDPASAEHLMRRLVDAGFTLALDDFGTGYSSLAYLARFPIHTLKIDRSFVRDMLDHAQSRTIVESTVALARGLGLQVTAEGVEQQAEAALLRQLGCQHAQGYLFSRPIRSSDLIALWQQGNRFDLG